MTLVSILGEAVLVLALAIVLLALIYFVIVFTIAFVKTVDKQLGKGGASETTKAKRKRLH